MSNVLFVHDDRDFANTRVERWQRMGIDVEACTTARQCLEKVLMGLGDTHTIILHKDLGQHRGEKVKIDHVVQSIQETYETIRLGVVRGEFPDGKWRVLSLNADFYFPTTLEADHDWLLKQLHSGYVGQRELSRRGKEVAMP